MGIGVVSVESGGRGPVFLGFPREVQFEEHIEGFTGFLQRIEQLRPINGMHISEKRCRVPDLVRLQVTDHVPEETVGKQPYLLARLLHVVFSEVAHPRQPSGPYRRRINFLRYGNEPHIPFRPACLLACPRHPVAHRLEAIGHIVHERMPWDSSTSVISQIGRPTTFE